MYVFSKLWLASDHRGVEKKKALIEGLRALSESLDLEDLGPWTQNAVDYPQHAHHLAQHLDGEDAGILICGTGIGMSIAANRYPHLRAALCHTPFHAEKARQHNNANVLVWGANDTELAHAFTMLQVFLTTPFEGGRHQRRVESINALAAPSWIDYKA